MSYLLKQGLASVFAPLIRGGLWWQRCTQFWAYAQLHAQLPNVPASVVVLAKPELHGTRRIFLGQDLYLYPDLYWETREQGCIEIGDGVVLSRGVHLVAYQRIVIGAGSMLGEYVSVRDANHRIGRDVAPRYSGHDAAAIHIGRNVWIGRGACILAGVHIADGAVVGANAVVTHDVAAHTVVAGVPARLIKEVSA